MKARARSSRATALAGLLAVATAAGAAAQPVVVPGVEGQIGPTAGFLDKVFPPDFAPVSIPGDPAMVGDTALARILDPGLIGSPTEVQVFEERLHSPTFPAFELDSFASDFAEVAKVAPAVEPWLSDDELVAMSFALDGSTSGTLAVQIIVFDVENGFKTVDLEIDDIPTFDPPVGSPLDEFADTDIAVDDEDFLTAVFTEFPPMSAPRVKAQRVDGDTGDLLDLIDVNLDGLDPEVAILKPDGETMIIPSVDATDSSIQGNFVEIDEFGDPSVAPEIAISTTVPAFFNQRPAVAADPVSGVFTVTWDHVTGVMGDPSNIRGRRFDADGLPIGGDFQVNVPALIGEDDSQGQSDVAYGPGGLSVVTWADDGATGDPDTDVIARAFLPDGTPILEPGMNPLLLGQFRVNTGNTPGGPLSDRQDQPKVRFLPHPDSEGRPQFAVVWRDVGDGGGGDPNGTGTSYRCFAIDGLEAVMPIFTDGFESGDLASWSSSTP